jgi:hypothetical protein
MEAMTIPTAEPSVRRSRKPHGRTSARADKLKDDSRVKATIVMDRKLHWLLSSIAGNQGMDGSELAASLIERGLRERHSRLYEALADFEPKVPKREKSAVSVMTDGSAGDAAGVNPPIALAV